MHKGKHISTTPARKAKVGKTAAVAVAVILAVVLAVGGTVAYLTTHTQELTNIFSPSTVQCEVAKVNDTEHIYSVQNTGDVEAYIRVAIVCNWVDGGGNVHWQQPEFDVTYNDSVWLKGSDGFYYYKNPVAPQTDIGDTLTVTLNGGATDGYKFSVQVLAEAIQSEPITTVTSPKTWGVTVDGNRIVRK